MCESHILHHPSPGKNNNCARDGGIFIRLFKDDSNDYYFFFVFIEKFDSRLMGVVVYSKFIQNQILLFYNFSSGNIYDVFLLFSHFFVLFFFQLN